MKSFYDAFMTYGVEFYGALRDMGARGIPVDDAARTELLAVLRAREAEVVAEIQEIVQAEGLQLGKAKHIKRKERKCSVKHNSKRPLTSECERCAGTDVEVVREASTVHEPFNPASPLQVKAFMKAMGHAVPKHANRTNDDGTAADSTEMKELERLYKKTRHPLYPKLVERRQVQKMASTYVEAWAPGPDGRVHSTFTIGQTATGQTSSRNPNAQNTMARGKTPEQKKMVHAFLSMMTASSREHRLVNFDFKSFHAQTTACEMEDASYLRMARIDLHSYNTARALQLPEVDSLLGWEDEALKAYFKEHRRSDRKYPDALGKLWTFAEVRDGRMKSAGLGIGFGMGAHKLHKLYAEDFPTLKVAEAAWNAVYEAFPRLRTWQQEVKDRAARQGYLVNRFGFLRHYYDVQRWSSQKQGMIPGSQAEAAIAFLPASNAFGMVRSVMNTLNRQGVLERYHLINHTHDSLKFNVPAAAVDACIEAVVPVMAAPCPEMIYGIAPEGLAVGVDYQVGYSQAEMH